MYSFVGFDVRTTKYFVSTGTPFRMQWYERTVVTIIASTVFLAGVAGAHEVGASRFDAPIPLSLLFVGAGATVGLTAAWLGVIGRPSYGFRPRHFATLSPQATRLLARLARWGFFLAFVGVLYTGLLGRQVRAENFATVFVWPIWLRGVGLIAIIAGSPWSVLSPWVTVYDALAWLESHDIALFDGYPPWLNEWPALVGFVAGVGVVENLTVMPRSPRLTATVVAAYALVMVAGGICFGREWFRRADALAVLYRLFGRAAPIEVSRSADRGTRLRVRPPWYGATDTVRSLAVVAFAVATVYTVSFDGFTSTPEYQTVIFQLRTLLGVGPVVSVMLYGVGLVVFFAAFAVVVAATDRLSDVNEMSWSATARALAPTVLPIAVAYELAHNYPYVLRNVGQLAAVLGDILHTSVSAVDPLWWLSLPMFWWSQVVLIVSGHIVAVVAAHEVTQRRYSTLGDARRAHIPLTALMIGYTVLSLWIVSRPVVS
jgi:hypothetical protein